MRIRPIACAAVIAITAIGGSAATTSTRATAGDVLVQPAGLDHYKCYPVTATAVSQHPLQVRLRDQFGAVSASVALNPHRLCNPVEKTHGTKVYPPANLEAHLVCYRIAEDPAVTPKEVRVRNQFGDARMTVVRATRLCLPSWKRLAQPFPTATAPPGRDHFKCYAATYSTQSRNRFENKPEVVGLRDQFKQSRAQVKEPTELCVPVEKTLPTGQVTPIRRANAHLVCFGIVQSPANPVRTVFVKNQFGRATLSTQQPNALCLPSFKALITTVP